MDDEINPGYDSFVVRMWHDQTGEAVLRAEIEHVQTGAVDVRKGEYWAETSDWLRSRLLGKGRAREARTGGGTHRAFRVLGTLVLVATLLVTGSVGASASGPRPTGTALRVGRIPASARSLPAQFGATSNADAPVSEKLDGLMNHVAREARSAAADGLATARAGGARTLGGRIHALISFDPARADAVRQATEGLGGRVETVGNAGTMAQVFLPPRAIEGLAHRDDVLRIAAVPEVRAEAGSYLTEGFAKLNGPAWHSAGYSGAGVKVGIIDVGFQGYGSISTDLPAGAIGGVRNFTDGESSTVVTGGSPHGTACAEIIHDIAPGATLYLAKVGSALDIEEAADWLHAQGVRLISSSIGVWNVSPGDGTGYLENVVAEKRAAGILWITAAGNDRENHWGGAWTDANANGYLDYASGEDVNYLGSAPGSAYYIGAGNRFEVLVRWNDWTNPVDQDFKLYLVRLDPFVDSEWQVVADVNSPQTGLAGQEPTESAVYMTTGDAYYGFVIQRVSATVATNFEVFAHIGAGLAYPTYPRSLANLGDSDSALTVAAIDANALTHEPYSSQGPTNGAGGTLSGGKMKPDLSGFANVSTASYDSLGFNGTSAATPHVSGAAALVLSAQAAFTPSQLESFLTGRAVDQGTGGVDTVFGYGRLNLSTPPAATGDTTPPVVSAPVADFRVAAISGTNALPIKVSFSATDPSGISATGLQVKVGTGSFTNVTLPSPRATSVDIGLGASATALQYQAQATDGASPGNTSAFVQGPQLTVRAYQDGAPEVVQSGSWSSAASASHYGGSARYTAVAGPRQSFTATATDLAIVSTRGPNRGKAAVYVDGVLKTTLDLYRSTTAYRQVVYVISFPSPATHTIELRPTGTKNASATGKRVDFDAFLAIQP